jgi:hypothetical protein
MKFEVGKFYLHNGGRKIVILSEVTSYKWNKMLVIEEVDATGHGISCAEVGQEANANCWVEIGREEFLKDFGG